MIRRNFWATCLYYVWDDWCAARRFARGDIASYSGVLHTSMELDGSVSYIQGVVADYLRYSGRPTLEGKAAEVGPGDNAGVGLLLLAGGCRTVDLVDRFFAHRDPVRQAAIYHELARHNAAVAQVLGGANLEDEETFPGLQRWYGEGASAEQFFKAGQDYDLIVSRAVLEHVRDPQLALLRMTEALKPGGLLLHKVDLRDHGMFFGYHHELKWLEIPTRLYSRMSNSSGRPNRALYHRYRSALAALPLETKLLITRLAGVGEIDPHLPYNTIPADLRERSQAFVANQKHCVAREFREVPLADLSVTGFFLVGQKLASLPASGPLPANKSA